jgi:hypothetical protein
MPRYPKPDGEKVSRNTPAFAWVTLPARREGGAPPLPRGYRWREETIEWWEELWCKPQAAMWDPSGSTLEAYARLYDAMRWSPAATSSGSRRRCASMRTATG